MSTPQEQEASEYLRNHQIIQLMNNLTSLLLFYKPERPREFLIAQLEQIQLSKIHAADSLFLFNDSDLDAVFGILDLTNQGYISYNQYKKALKILGIQNFNEHPENMANDRISRETFKQEAKHGLLKLAATYQL